ncbi:MAG: hypothetical protein EG826_13065 [Deltaproteobacteria bacterium]|nr:hypothetical protein [Deltaproteobacteria bacterium]
MKRILPVVIFACLAYSSCLAADWKSPADLAIAISPAAAASLENKKDKSAQDIYILTIVYYREFQLAKLKQLLGDEEKRALGGPQLKLLQGITFMGEHRYEESRAVLAGLVKTHPDFYPASVALAHLDYLQKDFDRSYQRAVQLIGKRRELSRFHFTVSLMLAAGAKGVLAKRNLLVAIPAYFEVKGYLEEAQKQMPDAAEVLYAVGSYHLLTPAVAGGDVERAIALLERSKRLTPLNPHVYVRLAQAYRACSRPDVSRRYLRQAAELDPRNELLVDDLSGEKAFLDVF